MPKTLKFALNNKIMGLPAARIAGKLFGFAKVDHVETGTFFIFSSFCYL